MSDVFDTAVVGAGLAGSCAAILLAQSGARVLLLDGATPGRHKVCGEFLSPESRVQLARVGVLDELRRAGAKDVATARVSTSTRHGRSVALPGKGLAVSRATLDAILWRRAREVGVETRGQTRVSNIEQSDEFNLQTNGGDFSARFVVSATGRGAKSGRDHDELAPPKQRFVGLKTHLRGVGLERGEVAMFPFAGGYCGLVEVEDGSVNACLLAPYARLKGNSPAALWKEIRAENRQLGEVTRGAELEFDWLATGNVSFEHFAPTQNGMLRVGDAAGYIHPLSGDGMAMAMRSGELAARSIQEALKWNYSSGEAAHFYGVMWEREFGRRLKWARALQPLFTHSLLSNAALRFFDALPALARLVARRTRGPVAA